MEHKITTFDTGVSARAALTRRDLIRFEPFLREMLGRFLKFETASLYFPRTPMEIRWFPDERQLFLPLCVKGKQLGVFVAGGTRISRGSLSLCAALADLCMENVQLRKTTQTDAQTGLATRGYGLGRVSFEIGAVRRSFYPGSAGEASGNSGALFETDNCSSGFFGILVFYFPEIKEIARRNGHLIADRLISAMADAMWRLCPQQALAARGREDEFFLFLPKGTDYSCHELGIEIVRALNNVSVPCEFAGRSSVPVAAGYACYPKDIHPAATARENCEQARILLDRAGQAAIAAAALFREIDEFDPVMGFGHILTEGGRVLQPLPMGRVRVSLGRAVGAREGQRYAVWGNVPAEENRGHILEPRSFQKVLGKKGRQVVFSLRKEEKCSESVRIKESGIAKTVFNDGACANNAGKKWKAGYAYKGELELSLVRAEDSFADTLSLGDPACPFSSGDQLVLLPEVHDTSGTTSPCRTQDLVPDGQTGLLRYRDFLPRWAELREHCDIFCLAVLRLNGLESLRDNGSLDVDELMAAVAQLSRDILGREAIGGRYGLNSLIFFHPGLDGQKVKELHVHLAEMISAKFTIESVTGIAAYPYLFFRKADILDNCLKALDYALLLPPPGVGIFDSVAMTISADKLLSRGDSFGAIEEYKNALLADEGNITARNSLGVCLAGLGRHSEARRCFEVVLTREPDNVMAHYNMGRISQSLGETENAWNEYRKCLALDPGHTFAMLRLGQLAEKENQWEQARKLYQNASLLPGGGGITLRSLARLSMREGKEHAARELLHEALGHNPQDPLALQLLAHLYLNQGDDPEIALVLARESIALMPEFSGAWLELARALEACGRVDEARRARLRAAEL